MNEKPKFERTPEFMYDLLDILSRAYSRDIVITEIRSGEAFWVAWSKHFINLSIDIPEFFHFRGNKCRILGPEENK